jgi:hypothetical protein
MRHDEVTQLREWAISGARIQLEEIYTTFPELAPTATRPTHTRQARSSADYFFTIVLVQPRVSVTVRVPGHVSVAEVHFLFVLNCNRLEPLLLAGH